MRVVEIVSQGYNNQEATGAIFQDVSKVSDTVWHNGLIFKMINLRISPPMIKLITSFLKDRRFRVKCQASFLQIGSAKDRGWSPPRFDIGSNIFVADIPVSPGSQIAQYDDDTTILARSRRSD
jgi:hypothetical protein